MADKYSAVILVRDYFGVGLQDIKALTSEDRHQLGTAIARERGISQSDCEFNFVEY